MEARKYITVLFIFYVLFLEIPSPRDVCIFKEIFASAIYSSSSIMQSSNAFLLLFGTISKCARTPMVVIIS